MSCSVSAPFLTVNPKSYLYGAKCLEFALACDAISRETDLPIYFSCGYADIRLVSEATDRLIVCAQSMDVLAPGRGMGKVLPESLYEAGARAVFLNHAENPKTLSDLRACIERAHEVGLIAIVCADSAVESCAVAEMGADIVVAEPTGLIGTGTTPDDRYITETVEAIKRVAPDAKVVIGAGVTTGEDCSRVISLGADATGGTSGILNAPSPVERVREMADAVLSAYGKRL